MIGDFNFLASNLKETQEREREATENCSLNPPEVPKKIARIGAYGVFVDRGKMLAVRQKRGPFMGKLDFPGGGIEFGESPEQALRREFMEELEMEFDDCELMHNLTATLAVSETSSGGPYLFYQIGMIYRVSSCRQIKDGKLGELEHAWVDLTTLAEGECSALLWKYRTASQKL